MPLVLNLVDAQAWAKPTLGRIASSSSVSDLMASELSYPTLREIAVSMALATNSLLQVS
jgi:hypothetical protein